MLVPSLFCGGSVSFTFTPHAKSFKLPLHILVLAMSRIILHVDMDYFYAQVRGGGTYRPHPYSCLTHSTFETHITCVGGRIERSNAA